MAHIQLSVQAGDLLLQVVTKAVLGGSRLAEGADLGRFLGLAVGGRPLAILECDVAPLHLDDEESLRRVGHDEVGFAIALPIAAHALPSHRVKHRPVAIEFGESVIDLAF